MSNAEDRVTVWMGGELTERMDQVIDFGPPEYESRSEWVREAVRLRLVFEDALEHAGIELPKDEDDRERVLRDLAFEAVDAYDEPAESDE